MVLNLVTCSAIFLRAHHYYLNIMCVFSSQAMADYNTALQMGGAPPVKILVNRGLLHLQLMDHTSALLDFAEASKVHVCHSGSHTDHRASR